MKLGSLISINFYYGSGGRREVSSIEVFGGRGTANGQKDPTGTRVNGNFENKEERLGRTSQYRDQQGRPLSQEEVSKLLELKKKDREVHRHEAAHMAAGGR